MENFWIRLDQLNEGRSEFGVLPGELDGQGRENQVEVAPVFEVSGAEERGAESTVCEYSLRDCLRDGALPGPSKSVQPVDGGFVKVAGPEFDPIQDCGASTPKTTVPVAVSILSVLCTPDVV